MTDAPRTPPDQIDPATGLPQREVVLGVTTNPDPARSAATLALCIEAARLLSDDKCEDVLLLDLRGRSQVTDFFIIASGSSDRQLRSAGEHVKELAKSRGMSVFRSNLDEARANWIVIDLVDAVIHVLLPETRRYYDLEMLWGDAPRLSWERESASRAGAAGKAGTPIPGADPRTGRNRAGLTADDVLPGSSRQG